MTVIVCNVCSQTCSSLERANELEWDWFTGYFPERFVVCRHCQKNRAQFPFIDSQRALSKVQPPSEAKPIRSRVIVLR